MTEHELLDRLLAIEEWLREGQSQNFCRDQVRKLINDRWGTPNGTRNQD